MITKKLKFKIVGTMLLAAAVVFIGSAALATHTASAADPLTVTCSGTPTNNTIAWNATPSGGNSPYVLAWSGDPSVAGNTTSSFTATYTATGTINAMIQATDASSSIATSTCSATVTTLATSTPTSTPVADLSIAKDVDNISPNPGDTINYTITISALGPATSTGVTATDTLPTGLTFENATTSAGTYSSSTGGWMIGDMASGTNATLDIAAMVNTSGTAGTTITNTAMVGESSSTVNDSASDSSSASVNVQTPTSTATTTANLSIGQTVDNSNPSVGGTVNYMLTVSALGPSTSTGVMAMDMLPSGLTFVSATPSVGTYASSTGVWTIGDMMPNSTATLGIAAMVNSGTEGSTITNTATVSESASSTNTGTDTSSTASLAVMSPGGGGTSTSTTPLTVSCDFGFGSSGNVITWTASAAGGTAPYTYLWSGDLVAGATSTAVTETYPATGTVFATVQATDAAANTASSTCSASVTSLGSTTSTPPTTTSTAPFVPPTLSIGTDGSFSSNGMMVTGVASGSFQAEIWGITYTVNWNGQLPRFYFRNDNNGSSTNPSNELAVGDVVNVTGSVSTSSPLVVNAKTVRDDSITSSRHNRGGFGGFNFGSGFNFGDLFNGNNFSNLFGGRH